jgi:hypothetical protein
MNAGSTTLTPEPTYSATLTKRYSDAYRVAIATVVFGRAIKIGGMVLAGIIFAGALIPYLHVSQPSLASSGLLAGVTFLALVIGLLFYFLGVLVCAQGQILQASLDGSVNTSPFLTNDLRARIMSLPEGAAGGTVGSDDLNDWLAG